MKSVTRFLCVRGFTLIELMVTLAVGILLTSWVVFGIQGLLEKQRLSATVEALQAQLILAKSEATKRSGVMALRFTQGTGWALGVGEISSCDPALASCDDGACCLTYVEADGTTVDRRHSISSAEFPGAELKVFSVSGGASQLNNDLDLALYEPVRGTAAFYSDANTMPPTLLPDIDEVRLTLVSDNFNVQIRMDAIGQLSVCSPNLGRYPTCP